MLGIISDTVLDIRADRWPMATVVELDMRLERIATDIGDHRVRPVEVGLYDCTDITAPGLFIGVGGGVSYAIFHSRAGNEFISNGPTVTSTITEFEVPACALIPIEQAREAMRRFSATRRRPDNLTWELVPPKQPHARLTNHTGDNR